MSNQDNLENQGGATGAPQEKKKPDMDKTREVLAVIWKWVYRLRGVVLAIPVIIAAICLAVHNANNLPELVGINLQANGSYKMMIERGTAISVPLLITGGCLALTCLSRKTIFPWLISIFSLAIPVLIYITNIFPG